MAARSTLLCLLLQGALAAYSESRAVKFAKFAGAAYCSKASLETWSCGDKCEAAVSEVAVCPGDHTKAFVAVWEEKCMVSFQGTSDVDSFIKDLEVLQSGTDWPMCHKCKVHGGFLDEYNSVGNCVKKSLTKYCGAGASIRTTGHSLGAAMNGIAMIDLHAAGWNIEESYDFGKPRVGNEHYAHTFSELFAGKAWRVTHGMDPAPQVPPDTFILDWHYEHVEPEIYYRGKNKDGYKVCTKPHDTSECVEQFTSITVDLLHVADHLKYMDVAHMGGESCLEPHIPATQLVMADNSNIVV